MLDLGKVSLKKLKKVMEFSITRYFTCHGYQLGYFDRNFCDVDVLKNTEAENGWTLYFQVNYSEFINLFSLYISASNNPILPTQVKLFSPQLSRKANLMVWRLTGSSRWKTLPSLLPSWYSTVRSSKFLHS